MNRAFSLILLLILGGVTTAAEESIFSGPQVGEPLFPFKAKAFRGAEAGTIVDAIADPNAPTLVVFVHKVTRPGLGLTRVINEFASKQEKKLQTSLVFLTDDVTETEAWLRRASRALPGSVSPLISTDGLDGPGAYGLNRKATLTVLVGVKGKVIGNFPLVQPSIQADGPKIGHAMVKALGGTKAPTLKEMGFRQPERMNKRGQRLTAEQNARYRSLMAPVIRSDTKEDVDKAAKTLDAAAAKQKWLRDQVGRAASQIISGGKLENYGIARAQEHLKRWAKEYGPRERPQRENVKRRDAEPPAEKEEEKE